MKLKEEGGTGCPHCLEPAKYRTCSVCGDSLWVVDCGHQEQPRPIAAGREDGSQLHLDFCATCAEKEA